MLSCRCVCVGVGVFVSLVVATMLYLCRLQNVQNVNTFQLCRGERRVVIIKHVLVQTHLHTTPHERRNAPKQRVDVWTHLH
jgi:hypothetical protein